MKIDTHKQYLDHSERDKFSVTNGRQTGLLEIKEILYATLASHDPISLADGVGETTAITVAGAALGDFCLATFSLDLEDTEMTASVQAANLVEVRHQNGSGGVVDLDSGTLRVMVIKL